MNTLQTSFSQQINTDILYWQQKLNLDHYPQNYDQQKALFLQRLFLVLYHAGLLVKETYTSHYIYAKNSSLPLVCYFSHGCPIKLSMETTTFPHLLNFLYYGQLLAQTQTYQEQLYIADDKETAELNQRLLYKNSAKLSTKPFTWQNTVSSGQEDYSLCWQTATESLILKLIVSKRSTTEILLTLWLQGYPHLFEFYEQKQAHPLLQAHKAEEQANGKEFLIPHPLFGIKGELSQAELVYISQIPFSFEILAQAPTEHQEADLNSKLLPPLTVFYQSLQATEAQACFNQFILEQYKAYTNLKLNQHLERRDFIKQWLGNLTDTTAISLLTMQRDLLAKQFLTYSAAQQHTIHTQLIDPLIRLLTKELMVIIKLL